MTAGKAVDAFGLQEGYCIEQSDAEAAYTQTEIQGTPTWVRLPQERWPEDWKKRGLTDPVCPLVLALYGHPDAGGYWEKHCEKCLSQIGFVSIPLHMGKTFKTDRTIFGALKFLLGTRLKA